MTPNLEHLEKLQKLTKEYAQFSKTSSGMIYIVVVLLLIPAQLLGKLLPLSYLGSILGIILSIFLTSTWLFIRWQLVQRFYQNFGAVRVATPVFEKGFMLGLLVGGVISICFLVGLQFFTGLFQFPETFRFAAPIFVFTGIFAFQTYKNHGVPLAISVFVFGAMIGGSINQNAANLTDFQRGMQPFTFALLILCLFSIGLREHQQFKQLEKKFKNLGTS